MNANSKSENRALARTVLELDVKNHAGVMSHVVGMFSRRAYNVEGIVCMPVETGAGDGPAGGAPRPPRAASGAARAARPSSGG